ncbi:hypothetical protein SUGI_0549240 [Cryptomeria japonica]|nr:hypothetical protein SUGI_0549240 [Cryptomeria japonica]
MKPYLAGVKNKDWNLLLHEAAKCGNPDVVRILLQHRKRSSYHYNKFEETALIIASKFGHVETVKLLLEAREYKDAFETRRSVRVAAYRGYADVAKAILNNPVKPRWIPRLLLILLEWDTYKDFAIKAFRYSLIAKFVSLQISSVNSPLHAAVHGGHVEIVEAVLNCCEWNKDFMTKKDSWEVVQHMWQP